MVLSDRQRDILNKAVFEYIDRAEPVSSSWLEEAYGMPFSPATIRNELMSLTEEGYLEQPHSSSGRVPTDKGYRFFLEESTEEHDTSFSDLILAYHQNILWKEGWEQVLREPEFARSQLLLSFTKYLADIENNLKRMRRVKHLQVYIGRENPFSSIGDFSMIVRAYDFQEGQSGFVAIVGPKRMPYHKNIGLMHSIANIWKKRLKR
jgi:transcriptional regulator of heat shock response